jgi:hypothetical protein
VGGIVLLFWSTALAVAEAFAAADLSVRHEFATRWNVRAGGQRSSATALPARAP